MSSRDANMESYETECKPSKNGFVAMSYAAKDSVEGLVAAQMQDLRNQVQELQQKLNTLVEAAQNVVDEAYWSNEAFDARVNLRTVLDKVRS